MNLLRNAIQYSNPELSVDYDYVAIVDGLNSEERDRYRISDKLKMVFNKENLILQCNYVDSLHCLKTSLLHLFIKADRGDKFIIHFVSHGNEVGVKVGCNFVTWATLGPMLEKINNKMKERLIVNMSTCRGLHGIKMSTLTKNRPFFGLIGAKRDLKIGQAIKANKLFYRHVANGMPIQKVVPMINKNIGCDVIFNISSEGFRILKNRDR